MSWHLAPSLVQFRNEVNKKWPNRSKKSDGTKGDSAHAARKSDHNPNSRDSVNAIDITFPGVNAQEIIKAVSKHPSANYVIFDRKIYSRKSGWKAEKYTGASPHTEHLHISILQTVKAEQSKVHWFTAPAPAKPTPAKPVAKPVVKPTPAKPAPAKPVVVKPTPAKPAVKPALPKYPGAGKFKVGSQNPAVKVVQTALGNPVTGTMTKEDVADVKKYQRLRPKLWPADGIVGPKTYASLANTPRVKAKYKV